VRRVTAAAAAVLAVLLVSTPSYADGTIELPKPGAALAQELQLVCNPLVGGLPERCKKSSVPGPVVSTNKSPTLPDAPGGGHRGRGGADLGDTSVR